MPNSQETFLFKSSKGIVVAVISIGLISLIFAVTINPIEFVRFHRDRKRTQDLKSLSNLISQIEEKVPEAIKADPRVIYTSLPDNDPNCSKWLEKGLPEIAGGYSYRCQQESDYLNNDGSGWVPIDFTTLGSEAPQELFKDPQNGKRGRDPESGEKVVFYYQYLFGSSVLGGRRESSETMADDLANMALEISRDAYNFAAKVSGRGLIGEESNQNVVAVGNQFFIGDRDAVREIVAVQPTEFQERAANIVARLATAELVKVLSEIVPVDQLDSYIKAGLESFAPVKLPDELINQSIKTERERQYDKGSNQAVRKAVAKKVLANQIVIQAEGKVAKSVDAKERQKALEQLKIAKKDQELATVQEEQAKMIESGVKATEQQVAETIRKEIKDISIDPPRVDQPSLTTDIVREDDQRSLFPGIIKELADSGKGVSEDILRELFPDGVQPGLSGPGIESGVGVKAGEHPSLISIGDASPKIFSGSVYDYAKDKLLKLPALFTQSDPIEGIMRLIMGPVDYFVLGLVPDPDRFKEELGHKGPGELELRYAVVSKNIACVNVPDDEYILVTADPNAPVYRYPGPNEFRDKYPGNYVSEDGDSKASPWYSAIAIRPIPNQKTCIAVFDNKGNMVEPILLVHSLTFSYDKNINSFFANLFSLFNPLVK